MTLTKDHLSSSTRNRLRISKFEPSRLVESVLEIVKTSLNGMGNSGSGSFDLMALSKPEVCVWNILRYSLRNWNGRGKEQDLEKIAHYAELAWTMGNGKIP